jgi:hypothetical protein
MARQLEHLIDEPCSICDSYCSRIGFEQACDHGPDDQTDDDDDDADDWEFKK